MISVITPTYETPADVLARTWNSLTSQTYTAWEWIIWDDSHTQNVWRQVYGYCADERYIIHMHKSHVHSGIIGNVKRQAFMVANGDILVELDHDDELTPNALQEVAEAFKDESVGFAYSNWCEINEQGNTCRYPEGWAFGYGSEYQDEDGLWVMRAPELNSTTLSHIVSAPNHVRAWRASVYRNLNGHDRFLRVADDYDLVVRTALATKCVHIDKLLYKQHINQYTAQRVYNKEIQQNVRILSDMYAEDIKEKYNDD